MKLGVLSLALAFAGCGATPNPASCVDNHCSDPERPYCDKDGSVGGEPNTCIAVACTPGEFERCDGGNAMHCNALGNGFEELQCEEGCGEPKGCNECKDVGSCATTHIVPRYLPSVCDALAPGGDDLVIVPSMTIDTSIDANCNGGVVAQPTGPFLCVLRYRSIIVPSGRTLTFTGPRAVALVADDALSIEGALDVSAHRGISGPGARLTLSGDRGISYGGGGGAGYQTPGGEGADAQGFDGGNGGAAIADPVFEPYLDGGAKAFCFSVTPDVGGGGGGGAITLVSCRGQVSVSGTVNAGGGGGGGSANDVLGEAGSSCGGGSGGHVVVQGRTVVIGGSMFANGGGGGAGYTFLGSPGARGEDGSTELNVPALGGAGVNGAGSGGNGAGGNFTSGNPGGVPTAGATTAGAGGGGWGFLQVFTPFGVEPIVAGARTSPPLSPHRKLDMK